VFDDVVNRRYNQDSFSTSMIMLLISGALGEILEQCIPYENHPITPADIDVDIKANKYFCSVLYGRFALCSFLT